jgi:hypothetical protein
MYRKAGMIVLFAVVLGLALTASPVYAGGASCSASPTAGPPGTTFTFFCSGFDGNTILNVYAVEPDGRAVAALQIDGFQGDTNNPVKTDVSGNASFSWTSAGGGSEGFAHQIGSWTWVAHELGLGGSIIAQGQATVQISSVSELHSGASLALALTQILSQGARSYTFGGSGFARDELVNIWVTLPADCSGRFNVDAASADEPSFQGFYDGFSGPNTVKADEDGNIAFTLTFFSQACRGFYTVTARALGSGAAAEAGFEVTGDAVSPEAVYTLAVSPSAVSALNPFITLLGGGFDGGDAVNCWTTRPDGRVFPVGSAVTDANGNFALTVHASGFDSFAPFASEEPGSWTATCRDPSNGDTAIASFTVYGLVSDP